MSDWNLPWSLTARALLRLRIGHILVGCFEAFSHRDYVQGEAGQIRHVGRKVHPGQQESQQRVPHLPTGKTLLRFAGPDDHDLQKTKILLWNNSWWCTGTMFGTSMGRFLVSKWNLFNKTIFKILLINWMAGDVVFDLNITFICQLLLKPLRTLRKPGLWHTARRKRCTVPQTG